MHCAQHLCALLLRSSSDFVCAANFSRVPVSLQRMAKRRGELHRQPEISA